jgi:hypothetical protein
LRPSPAEKETTPSDAVLTTALGEPASEAAPLCPVDRWPRRRRNGVCIAIIALGLLNYLAYTLAYAALGGDAHNGHREIVQLDDGTVATKYFVRGHHLNTLSGREHEVSRGAWIYSYLHSISVPITWGAVLISMLVLARPHILATMRGGWISGQTFVTAFGTIVVLVSAAATFLFAWHFAEELAKG